MHWLRLTLYSVHNHQKTFSQQKWYECFLFIRCLVCRSRNAQINLQPRINCSRVKNCKCNSMERAEQVQYLWILLFCYFVGPLFSLGRQRAAALLLLCFVFFSILAWSIGLWFRFSSNITFWGPLKSRDLVKTFWLAATVLLQQVQFWVKKRRHRYDDGGSEHDRKLFLRNKQTDTCAES